MGLSENSDDHIYKRHQELCRTLNMDSSTTDAAWDSYESIRQHYTLEGDPLHWLGCSIYVACRKTTAPTVGQTGAVVNGNCVSLTRLLRLCNFSLTQFFDKSKKWADMANMPAEFRTRIDNLERNFTVSCNVFKKFHVIFNEIFLNPVDDQPRQHRPRKQRNLPCTPARVFEFCWTLFVCIKGEFATCSDDLVASFHLLLACCDMAFSNALLAERTDLLNSNFEGLPTNWASTNFVKPVEAPCIIHILCKKFAGLEVEAKWVKEYPWKEAVVKLFNNEILRGDIRNLSGLFDPANFDLNLKSVNKIYEEHVLNVGEFDEKIFLDGDINNTIGSPRNTEKDGADKQPSMRILSNQYDDSIPSIFPQTPLTGRKYLHGRGEPHAPYVTPLLVATQSVIRLQTLLKGRQADFSPEMIEVFKSCTRNPVDPIKNRVKEMGDLFKKQFTSPDSKPSNNNLEFANKRLLLSEILYYKLLENVIQEERMRNPNLDLTFLLEQDVFHQCMLACSIEIVLYSHNTIFKFPWVLNALNLKAYYFYRVIELIVRTKDQLSRDVVKHLNSIEEQILESIAWESDSPLWECIKANPPVPSCEDTTLPGHTDSITNLNIKKLQAATTMQSPISSASERFQSPIPTSVVKKKLFPESQLNRVKPGQSLLQNASSPKTMAIFFVDDKGNQKLFPISEISEVNTTPNSQVQLKPEKPKRNGSLALFFRKFYNLAGVRMEELCNELNINDMELKRKIFTCFEYTIIEKTKMMKDRHLDQILMCAVYVVCKVTCNEKSFTEIMRCYRLQPQADSHVYRSVLVKRHSSANRLSESEERPSMNNSRVECLTSDAPSRRSNPAELAGTSTSHELEDRCDLIMFYNTVYIENTKAFALRLKQSEAEANLTLSPLPVTKQFPQASPKRRVIDNVYVRPYEHSLISPNATKQYSYFFSRSPSKDLQNINMVINSRVGKRLLTGDEVIDDVTPAKMTRKLQGLIEERLGQTKE